MNRLLLVCVVGALVLLAGCKGHAKYKDSPKTLKALGDCQSQMQDKQKYIAQLEKRVSDLELNGGQGVVVTVEGDQMKISGKGPNERAKGSSAEDAKLYKAFLAATRHARGLIKKCYQGALKKNSAIQARTIKLDITVNYRADGKVSGASFSPDISANFNRCMKAVTRHWTLPASPSPVTFKRTLMLTPE